MRGTIKLRIIHGKQLAMCVNQSFNFILTDACQFWHSLELVQLTQDSQPECRVLEGEDGVEGKLLIGIEWTWRRNYGRQTGSHLLPASLLAMAPHWDLCLGENRGC